ncbi:MAG: hypothetical protein ACFFD2_00060 [Promethearchaeota archaeon]
MTKRKNLKIDPIDLFLISPDQTLIRPKSISLTLENRGKDYKLEYTETFQNKHPPKSQEWTIDTTLSVLKQIQDDLNKYNKYFYYQIKAIKKGYQLMIISDDAFALVAAILAELFTFGVREKEDSYNITPFAEALVKWILKANIIDG